MREWIRKSLRWLDARLIGDDETFPVSRSLEGDVVLSKHPSGTMEIICSNLIETGPPVHVSEGERFRIVAFQGSKDCRCDDCGAVTYWLGVDFREPGSEEWKPLLMLPEIKLFVVAEVMSDMLRFLEKTERLSFEAD